MLGGRFGLALIIRPVTYIQKEHVLVELSMQSLELFPKFSEFFRDVHLQLNLTSGNASSAELGRVSTPTFDAV
ncbi:MAG: hypothetical protein ACKVHE_35650 [Planctomycetales bacterium]